MIFKNEKDRMIFEEQMKARDEKYDEAVRMSWFYRGKNGYHSQLSDCMVHGIQHSFIYAHRLLQRNEPGDKERAHDILYRVIPLQEINPAQDAYGVWPYYLEERLEEMAPPDWNMADFNGKCLLEILKHCQELLSEDIQMRIRDAVYHACQAIIKRDVHPAYTNISIMGSYVTLVAGEMFGWEDVFAYGRKRLQKLYDYNMSFGSFSEFNSPCYTLISLFDLSDLKADVQDADCCTYAEGLIDLAWATVAQHYHYGTGQLAGPHYRAYAMLLSEGRKLALERAMNYKVALTDFKNTELSEIVKDFTYNDNLRCPDKYMSHFIQPCDEVVMDDTFAPSMMAYTYMNAEYTIGSLRMEQLWNQHRNILGFFGTKEEPIAVNFKCLHDGWDYCSCLSSTIQDKNRLLTTCGFLTNAGDTHSSLDMVQDATISAEKLNLVWYFEGAVEYLEVRQIEDAAYEVKDRRSGLRLILRFPYVVFGEYQIRYEVVRRENVLEITALLYDGERVQLCFRDITEAVAVTTLEIIKESASESPVSVCKTVGTKLEAEWGNLKISAPLQAGETKNMRTDTILYRDGEVYTPAY